MPLAWQVREHQQQEFIRQIAGQVKEEAERHDSYHQFLIRFARDVLEVLWTCRKMAEGAEAAGVSPKNLCMHMRLHKKIEAFIRVPSEEEYLWHLLFKEIEPAIASAAASDYSNDKVHNPEDVYGAPAMQEVDI